MKNRRLEVINSLLILFLALLFGVGVVQWWRVSRKIQAIHANDAKMVIGTDEKLSETVQGLENALKERLEYQYDDTGDPLDLTKVVTSKRILEKMGLDEFERTKLVMRLAATIVGKNGNAACIIRYMGSNHILHIGDELAGYKVTNIDRKTATLVKGGEKKVLYNQKAPENEGNYVASGMTPGHPLMAQPGSTSGNY
jgi:hypothetical protein